MSATNQRSARVTGSTLHRSVAASAVRRFDTYAGEDGRAAQEGEPEEPASARRRSARRARRRRVDRRRARTRWAGRGRRCRRSARSRRCRTVRARSPPAWSRLQPRRAARSTPPSRSSRTAAARADWSAWRWTTTVRADWATTVRRHLIRRHRVRGSSRCRRATTGEASDASVGKIESAASATARGASTARTGAGITRRPGRCEAAQPLDHGPLAGRRPRHHRRQRRSDRDVEPRRERSAARVGLDHEQVIAHRPRGGEREGRCRGVVAGDRNQAHEPSSPGSTSTLSRLAA